MVYDVLKLTPFYKAFQITTDVPEIYMQEFWATATVHHHSIRFKMNNKKHIVHLEYFREMLQICPKLPDQQFEELPFEEEILTFLRDLGHSGEIKVITDVNVNKLHQPWRSFVAGMYHKKNVDYAYLLWEDFVYQVENKNVKRSNEMYYPRFTKVIVNFFMTKDQSIPRRNKVNWHFARDDYMFTMIKVVSRHEDTQLYGAILPNELTNEAIKDSESYKEYYVIASGAEPPKTKASVKKKQARSDKAPKAPKGKRLKATAKVTKPSKKKLPTEGLETLSEVALTEEEQMRIVTKISLTQFHSSHASGSGTNEGTSVTPGVPDVPKYYFDDEHISWKSSSGEDDDAESENDDDVDDADNQDDDGQEYDVQDDESQDANNEQTDLDNDGDDFVYPKLSTHDKEDKEEDSFDPRVQTPSHVESTDYEDSDEEIQEGRDTEMTDAPRTIIQTTQVIKDTHVIITPVNLEGQQQSSSMSSGFVSNMLNPSPDTGIDSIFNLNNESTSLVDVLVTTIAEPPLLSVTILPPPPPTPLITHLQQTPVPTPATVLSSSLQDLTNFAVSSILGIVDAYLANKMHESVKTSVQLQSNRPRDEAQAENADLINKLDDNIKKIVKEQTSQAIAANLSELELKKILIYKMESNKTINISDEQKNLYKALFDAYESDKLILDTYGDTISFKRCRDDEDKDEEPSVGSNRGSKRRRAGKEPESTSAPKDKTSKTTGKSFEGSKSHHKSADKSAQAEEPMHIVEDLEELVHQEFVPGDTEDIPDEETSQLPDWFQKPEKPPTLDRDWNKTLPAAHGPVQPWLSTLAQKEDTRESFNKLMDTPLDFSTFVMNRLKVDTLTPELLAGPTFKLMKGSCKSLVELEYFFEEVYKATTDQLDWNNPEGQQYPHDLRKPLPLIPNSRGRQVIPFDHFINNDLAYLSGGVSSRKYTTSVTKTKAADYGHIKWIEDLVPNRMWSQVPVSYDKHALWGISHWGRKRQQFYGFAANRESARDVYSKRRIIAVTKLQIVEWHNYKHLDWITIRRDDDKLYKFKEGDFNRLRIQDIEDMLLLLVQGKLTNLTVEERLAFNVSLRMFTRSIVIQRRVEDLQLGVESYQKKLNLTKPDTYRSDLKRREAYTAYSNPRGFIYQNKDKKNRLMRIDELHKFSDGTLNDVRTALDDRLKGIRMKYLPQTIWRQSDRDKAGAMIQAIDKQLKTRRIMRSLEKFVERKQVIMYLSGGVSSRKYTTSVTMTKAADYGHIKWIEDLIPECGVKCRESARDVYSKRRIIAVTKLQIVEWRNYKHLDWITVRRDDGKLYTFKEGDFNRLRIQDIEDMLLLLVQGKLTNLAVEEHLAFNVSLRMFTRSIVIQVHVEDLQLGVETYSNPRGLIYQNKDKKNRLMRIDELHKFCDGTLNDVRTALNDRLKGIRMKYLPQTIWRQSDIDKAGAMIQVLPTIGAADS
ncbi:hypothetical protein Tco_0328363 [Tanacetum coccineum]